MWMREEELVKGLVSTVVNSVSPYSLFKKMVKRRGDNLEIREKRLKVSDFENAWFVGVGKASCEMIEAFRVHSKIEPKLSIAVVPHYYSEARTECFLIRSEHPIPGRGSIAATRMVRSVLAKVGKKDAVFFFISGGASSLLEHPAKPFTLNDISEITRLLLLRGANIEELNTVRTALSSIKGGRILKKLRCKIVFSFLLSDVVPDNPRYIGSGLTFPMKKNVRRAKSIMKSYGVDEERIKKLDEVVDVYPFQHPEVFYAEIGSNMDAVLSASKYFEALGFKCNTGIMNGEARNFGKKLAKEAYKLRINEAYVFGGETTVRVKGSGLGGRNQETVLSAMIEIEGANGLVVASFSTDGKDGPTDAAGAFADYKTAVEARRLNLNPKSYLLDNNSYTFFKKINKLIVTGETGTNVADVAFAFRR